MITTKKKKAMFIQIVIFTIVVVSCGWIGKRIDMSLTSQESGQSLGSLLWLIGPALCSIILVLFRKKGEKYLGLHINRKGNQGIYLISLLLFPVMGVVLLAGGYLFGVVTVQPVSATTILSVFLTWFVVSFFRTILEEVAWRGYLTERLLELRVNDWLIYLLVTLIWGTWHIPYYLFFYPVGEPMKLILSCYVNLACWSILFTEIYRITRSIWPCVILHAAVNAVQYLMLEPYFVIRSDWNIWLIPATGVLSCVACMIIGLLIRRIRITRESCDLAGNLVGADQKDTSVSR